MVNDISFLGAIPLGKIQSWECERSASIMAIPFPGQNSGKTEAIDTLGIVSYITIGGRWVGNFRQVQGYIRGLKTIADGQQLSSAVLSSPFVNLTDKDDMVRVGTISRTTAILSNVITDTNTNFYALGVNINDTVKNLVTGQIATVEAVIPFNSLQLSSVIFTNQQTDYAVTASINVKVISFKERWELPGLSWCDYELSVVHTA